MLSGTAKLLLAQRNQELRSIKDRSPIENYGCGARPIHPSPVLLSGSTELALRVMNIIFNIVPQHSKLGALPLRDGGGAKHSPPGDAGEKIW